MRADANHWALETEGSTISELRLVIRDLECDWSGTVHASIASQAVAGLAADPLTLAEFETAMERFEERPDNSVPFFENLSQGLCDEPHDAGLVIIDLVARLVVVDSLYESLGPEGHIEYRTTRPDAKKWWIRYHLHDDWLFTTKRESWLALAESRRRKRRRQRLLDVRDVLYGRPMLEFIVRKVLAAAIRREAILERVRGEWEQKARKRIGRKMRVAPGEVDSSLLTEEEITPNTYPGQEIYAHPFYDTIKEIHAAWMLSPRRELGGESPRTVAISQIDHIATDLQDRCEQWSRVGTCPRGLDETSHAFRYGGPGAHELVVYYSLMRAVLWSCWKQLAEKQAEQTDSAGTDPDAIGHVVAAEISRLEQVRDQWLDSPNTEFEGDPPRAVINRERARLPEAISGKDAIVDPDCPCCQMLGEMNSVGFCFYDCSALDDHFAFDIYCASEEEWKEQYEGWEEFNERFENELQERKRLGVEEPNAKDDGDSIWSSSYCVDGNKGMPLGVRLFGVGCRLAEIVVQLRDGADRTSTPPEPKRLIDQLNRDFGNLREILQNSGPELAVALFAPVVDRFTDTIGEVALYRPDLGLRCDSLVETVGSLLDAPVAGF